MFGIKDTLAEVSYTTEGPYMGPGVTIPRIPLTEDHLA